MGVSDWALGRLQWFIYLKDFQWSTDWSVSEHRKFDAYEHYAAICEGHDALC